MEGETIPKYLMKFTQCRDEIVSVGVTVPKVDLVSLELLCLPKTWHIYQDSVTEREKLLECERLWSDLVQEEIRWRTKDGTSSKDKEEYFSLVRKGKKAKGNKSQGEEGKRDLSKIRCFHCHE